MKKKNKNIEVKVKPVKGRAVLGKINGDPVLEIDKLTAKTKKNKTTIFLTGDPSAKNPEKTIRVHQNKPDAISRFRNRYPKITKRVGKLI